MRKAILIISTLFLLSCSKENGQLSNQKIDQNNIPAPKSQSDLNVKIKAGVIMKSGDVKAIARQEFLVITKLDLIDSWKKSYAIESQIKQQAEYDKKMAEYESIINRYKKALSDKGNQNNQEITNFQLKINQHVLDTKRIVEKWSVSELFNPFILSPIANLGDMLSNLNDLDNRYRDVLSQDRGPEYRNSIVSQYQAFKDIRKLASPLEDAYSVDLNGMKKSNDERNNFINEINEKINKRNGEYKANLVDKIVENIVLSFRTNLSGEANIKLPRGEYYIFGLNIIALSSIIWNHKVSIDSENQYIELSNDNAYSIDNADLVKELVNLLATPILESVRNKKSFNSPMI